MLTWKSGTPQTRVISVRSYTCNVTAPGTRDGTLAVPVLSNPVNVLALLERERIDGTGKWAEGADEELQLLLVLSPLLLRLRLLEVASSPKEPTKGQPGA